MTYKEAIIKVLEDNKGAYTYLQVYNLINEKKYFGWEKAKTPKDTIASRLGSFIRNKDSRVKRIKGKNGYEYYLSKYEDEIKTSEIVEEELVKKKNSNVNSYQEKDLHKLLSSYLNQKETFSKTIFHEKSTRSDSEQKWIHPDMVGINFLSLQNKSSNALMNVNNKSDAFDFISYEIKRVIKTDHELKKYFFQAVSNSSWANYAYLVAFDISQNLMDEMQRLNQSFGIGIIELKSKPFESEILFQSEYRELDFKTIDKLCGINPEFDSFINHVESILSSKDKRSTKALKKQFAQVFCDKFLETDSEIEKYCNDKNIPYPTEDEEMV